MDDAVIVRSRHLHRFVLDVAPTFYLFLSKAIALLVAVVARERYPSPPLHPPSLPPPPSSATSLNFTNSLHVTNKSKERGGALLFGTGAPVFPLHLGSPHHRQSYRLIASLIGCS